MRILNGLHATNDDRGNAVGTAEVGVKPKSGTGGLKMKNLGLLAALILSAALVQFSFCGVVGATSSELDDAFSRLDALAEELDKLLRALGNAPEAPPSDSTPLPPPEAVPAVPPDDSVAAEKLVREPAPVPVVDSESGPVCGSRQEIDRRMSTLEERYDANGAVLIAANNDLPAFRSRVLDEEGICARRLAEDVYSALAQVEVIDLAPDRQVADAFVSCIDRLREETDEKFNTTTSSIRVRRLANEMELLNEMTHRVTGLERALLRGISKRDRLVQELEQYRQLIQDACE